MQLTEEQKRKVAEWVAAGRGLSEIQKSIRAEFDISMTFIEVRFLVDDLGVILKDKVVAKPRAVTEEAPDEALGGESDTHADEEAPGIPGAAVKVEVDMVTKPGAVVSGTVVFSDGVKAGWLLDTMGRVALAASKEGYRPRPPDIQAFQEQLGRELQKRGF